MSLFLAIDAGGTKADYILADETRVLSTARSGTIKRMRVSAEVATENLRRALAELESESGRSLAEVEVTCIGTAGDTVPLVTEWLRQELGSRVGGRLLLLGDVEIALDAAFPDSHGILILAGTGSNVRGRAPNGSMAGAGGHGPMLADQGSGHRIGQRALRQIFRAIDQERETSLLPGVHRHVLEHAACESKPWLNSLTLHPLQLPLRQQREFCQLLAFLHQQITRDRIARLCAGLHQRRQRRELRQIAGVRISDQIVNIL